MPGTDSDSAALEVAAQVALRFGGHIDGIHVQREVQASISIGDDSDNLARMQARASGVSS